MNVYHIELNKKKYFERGSNSRPSACKADVITTTPSKHILNAFTIYFLFKNKNINNLRYLSKLYSRIYHKPLQKSVPKIEYF